MMEEIKGYRAPIVESGDSNDTASAAQPWRVMVVEDALDVAEALAVQLREWGYESRICTSGSEAIALAPYYRPNVVLIDIGLPDMNGWDLAKRLPSDALLVAVTARGEDDDFKRSTRAATIW